jgi:hypothetical protein
MGMMPRLFRDHFHTYSVSLPALDARLSHDDRPSLDVVASARLRCFFCFYFVYFTQNRYCPSIPGDNGRTLVTTARGPGDVKQTKLGTTKFLLYLT